MAPGFSILFLFPHSAPCMRVCPHTACPRSLFSKRLRLEVIAPLFITKSILAAASAFQQRFGGLSSSPACGLFGRPLPFHVPMILSVHLLLGACYGLANGNSPVKSYGLSEHQSLPGHIGYHPVSGKGTDPYIRRFVSCKNILTMSSLWTPGISLAMPFGFRLASAGFTGLHTHLLSLPMRMPELRECVSGRCPLIPHFGSSVLTVFKTGA